MDKKFSVSVAKTMPSLSTNCVSRIVQREHNPIINACATIEVIIVVKTFLENFWISFFERSEFTFIIIKSISELSLSFSNI